MINSNYFCILQNLKNRKKKILTVLKTKTNPDIIIGPRSTCAPHVPLTRPIPWARPGIVSLSKVGLHDPIIIVRSFAPDGYALIPVGQNR
jgi:hypothetical protein